MNLNIVSNFDIRISKLVMNIAILGGAFNPPHLGHGLIAKQILDFTATSEVWLTPCYQHTFQKSLAPLNHRITMTKMLADNKIKYCGEEINHQLSGNTFDLMVILKKQYPQHHFYFIIGSDNLKDFKKWGSWEKLITTTDFLVFPRPRFEYNLKKYDLDNKAYKFQLIRNPLLIYSNISSTNIRKRLKLGLSIDCLVPEKVKEYIEKNRLYT